MKLEDLENPEKFLSQMMKNRNYRPSATTSPQISTASLLFNKVKYTHAKIQNPLLDQMCLVNLLNTMRITMFTQLMVLNLMVIGIIKLKVLYWMYTRMYFG